MITYYSSWNSTSCSSSSAMNFYYPTEIEYEEISEDESDKKKEEKLLFDIKDLVL